MPFARWEHTLVDDAGNILNNATVEVRREEPGFPLANPIYEDFDGVTPKSNPFSVSDGVGAFHAVGGFYRIRVMAGGYDRTLRYVAVGTAQAVDTEHLIGEGDAVMIAYDRTELKSFDTTIVTSAVLRGEPGREGAFLWHVGDYAAEVAADTEEGIYVEADAVAASVGAWVRVYATTMKPEWFGASGDGSTDDSTAIQSAIDLAEFLSGGVVELAAKFYAFATVLTCDANNVLIKGQGGYEGGSTLLYTGAGATSDLISFAGTQGSGIVGVFITTSTILTAGYAVEFTSSGGNGGFMNVIDDVMVRYCFNGVKIESNTECRVGKIVYRNMMGTRGTLFTGTSGIPSYRCTMDDIRGDNPYPQTWGTVKTWATSTAFILNDIISVNGGLFQCSTAGTSAGVGAGPSGPPGTSPSAAFTAAIADGTAAWKYVGGLIQWLVQDNYAYSLSVRTAALLNGYVGFHQADTAATGSSYPIWAEIGFIDIDHPYSTGLWAERGEGLKTTNNWISSSLTANDVLFDTNHRGEITFINNRVMAAWQNGILLQSGPTNVLIEANQIGDNSVAGSTTYHGVSVGGGATDFAISGNVIGNLVGAAGNNQGYGVLVNSGASDHYSISGNLLRGNVTGGLIDGGSGTDKSVHSNVGALGVGTSLAKLASAFVEASSSGPASLDFAEDTDNGANRVRVISAAALAADRTFTLPDVDITFSDFIATLLDDASAATARTTLGLGTSAVVDTGTSGTKVALLDGTNTWSNDQTASAWKIDANGYFKIISANPYFNFDANDNLSYDRASDNFNYSIGGTVVATFNTAGIAHIGSLKSSGATAGIGYATGAGGTVTQATSKSTGVTLNKATGQITMNAAALAAATIVSFVLTDTAIAASDVLVLNHVSGGTLGAYSLNARCAAGSATIYVRNNTAGSLSEAIVIGFALIKAVIA